MTTPLRVLIVEDSEDDASLVICELERGGYAVTFERVDTAAAMGAALARAAWDVILCDFKMPQFSGAAALQLVKESGTEAPFIYVSGAMGEEIAVEAMKSGAHDYVMKNNLARLAPAVERELREAQVRHEHRLLEADRQRLVVELKAALVDVKRLSGLLSICAGCKKIRNERNQWQPLETYIQQHSEAHFSHGLCPECLNRIYGDLPPNKEG